MWTAELHHRFEAAVNTLGIRTLTLTLTPSPSPIPNPNPNQVNTLGIDHAKPQAISQLMNYP